MSYGEYRLNFYGSHSDALVFESDHVAEYDFMCKFLVSYGKNLYVCIYIYIYIYRYIFRYMADFTRKVICHISTYRSLLK